jgi:hypothetical protein
MMILILEDDTALCNGIKIALAAGDRHFALCHNISQAKAAIRCRFLLTCGQETKKHFSGRTLFQAMISLIGRNCVLWRSCIPALHAHALSQLVSNGAFHANILLMR